MWRSSGILSVLLVCLSFVSGEKYIETSALLTCMDNSQFYASQFSAKFNADTKKAKITCEIVSQIEGYFSADVEVYTYGIKAYTRDVFSCDIADTMCPISSGHFDVETNVDLGTDVTSQIPGIVYTMPDIDAIARVYAYQTDANGNRNGTSPIACVEATLTNGKTVQTKYASWGLFAVLMLGVIVAGITSLVGHISTASHIISNVVSLFTYFQGVALIGMMAVEHCPPMAAAWVQNFVWTMGFIDAGFMQTIMAWYVKSTGGSVTRILDYKDVLSIAVYKKKRAIDFAIRMYEKVPVIPGVTFFKDLGIHQAPAQLLKRLDLSGDYVTENQKDSDLGSKTLVVQGIQRVAYKANIEITNLFLTGATFFVVVGLFLFLAMLFVMLFIELLGKINPKHKEKFIGFRKHWHVQARGVLFRYFLVGFTQLAVLCLWELTVHDSAATVVIAVVLFVVVAGCLLYASIKVILLARKSVRMFKAPAYILYGNSAVLNRWGFLYVQFRATAYWFLIPMLAFVVARSAVIAFGQSNGKVQAVIFLVLELAQLIVLSVIKPFMDKKTNAFNIAIASVAFVNGIFFLFFSRIFGDKADVAASVCGVVFFILNAVFSLVLLIMIVVACIWALVRRDPDARYQPMKDDRAIFMEDNRTEKNNELGALGGAARDGYRESHLYYNENEFEQSSSNDHLSPERAHRRNQNAEADMNTGYEPYRGYEMGGLAQDPFSRPNDYSDNQQLLNNNSSSHRINNHPEYPRQNVI